MRNFCFNSTFCRRAHRLVYCLFFIVFIDVIFIFQVVFFVFCCLVRWECQLRSNIFFLDYIYIYSNLFLEINKQQLVYYVHNFNNCTIAVIEHNIYGFILYSFAQVFRCTGNFILTILTCQLLNVCICCRYQI